MPELSDMKIIVKSLECDKNIDDLIIKLKELQSIIEETQRMIDNLKLNLKIELE